MAQFSKQWCDSINTSMPYDFDIDDIVKDLYRDRYYPIKCEGLGFNCVHKDAHGIVWLSFGYDKNGNSAVWRRYKSLIIEQEKKSIKNEGSSI
jgi:hypothetical protein